MVAFMVLLSHLSAVGKSFKNLAFGAHDRLQTPGWVIEMHGRAEDKARPFTQDEEIEDSKWYWDGEKLCRHHEYATRDTEQQHRDQAAGELTDREQRDKFQQREEQSDQNTDAGNTPEAPLPRTTKRITSEAVHLVMDGKEHQFVKSALLGKGGDGIVDLYTSRSSSHMIAVKLVDVDMIRGQCRPPNEYVVLKKYLNEWHPNIIRLHACFFDSRSGEALIAMEFCNSGSVENMVKRGEECGVQITTRFLMHFIVSIVEALGFIHEGLRYVNGGRQAERTADHQPVIHRDIKLANILLRRTSDAMPDVVLADFGAAQLAAEASTTPRHSSLEVLEPALQIAGPGLEDQGIPTPAEDVYAFGVCVCRLLCCGRDVAGDGLAGAYDASGLGDTAFTLGLLQRCLGVDAQSRPSTEELFLVAGRLKAWLTATGSS